MVIQGSTARVHFNLGTKNGPMDLTDAHVYFAYRYGMYGQSKELPCTVSDAVGGVAQIILDPEVTADEGQMYYQLRIEFSDGTVLKSEKCSIYIEEGL